MRRSLVLTDETAGHPFLASLPPHIRAQVPPVKARTGLRLTRDDIRGFVAAYLGCFVAVSIFIS
ncbi:hypothetical protein QWY75_05660 [Pontixanthobacter aestiaquae]|uniref:Uncharacterized protein n=1 Tax=Pontixanthobacter aestiaquae TaxID=1509367 RepID=A0A844Z3P6_9SPHN|nr:hypothetical protein [Pontixanthobacter aestiaquae]MDN3645691.1 hypothetical protein [Pontixanthobacter aestiaquae]MXO83311.1 hypothetical protein [Pontixanthobacter aestiaquae]